MYGIRMYMCTRYQSGQHKVSAFVYAENKLFVKKFFLVLIFCWTLFPNKKIALENKAVIFVPKRLCLFSLQPAQKRNGCEGNKISPPNRFVGISEVVSRKFTHEYIYKLKVLYLISKLQVYM